MPDQVVNRDKVQIWTASLVNAEPIILQTFPAEEDWPFPQYHGACGRYVVVDYKGRPVSEFYKAPWSKRVDIAYQILKIADQLTHNKEEFSLYLTDVNGNNFVVDASGKVTIVDAEDIVVVDARAVRAAKPHGWEDIHESSSPDCSRKSFKECHPFSETQLCSHVTSDHNYYAVCRFLLSRYAQAVDTGFSDGGLLHDIPDVAKDEWDLEYLLNECAIPQRQRGRVQVVHKLIEALDNLRQNISKSAV